MNKYTLQRVSIVGISAIALCAYTVAWGLCPWLSFFNGLVSVMLYVRVGAQQRMARLKKTKKRMKTVSELSAEFRAASSAADEEYAS